MYQTLIIQTKVYCNYEFGIARFWNIKLSILNQRINFILKIVFFYEEIIYYLSISH